MTLREARAEGADALSRSAVESPALDAALLLAHAAGLDRAKLLARLSDPIAEETLAEYRALIGRRAAGSCVAYLVGRKEFRGLDFIVSPAVLVPRPDTETLVEAALEWIDARAAMHGPLGPRSSPRPLRPEAPSRTLRALDVCTGSGCVAISLKAERPGLSQAAADLSEAALEVARENARRLLPGGAADIEFFLGDLLEPVAAPYDLITANPPYVPSAVIETLAAEVRAEPRLALDGGADGLVLVRRLAFEAACKLAPGGRLLIEAGHDQAPAVAEILGAAGLVDIAFQRDLAGIERVTGGSKP